MVVLPPPALLGPDGRRAAPTVAGRGRAGVQRLLVGGAVATLVAAVAFDALAGEHPTHTAGLVLVTLAVAAVRLRLGGRHARVVSAVAGTVAAQPALHALTKLDPRTARHHDDGLLHMLVTDGPATAMQIAVSVAVVLAVAAGARFARLLLTALRHPVQLLIASPPPAPLRASIRVCPQRHGSMLRWCGWSLRAARRGPPGPAVP